MEENRRLIPAGLKMAIDSVITQICFTSDKPSYEWRIGKIADRLEGVSAQWIVSAWNCQKDVGSVTTCYIIHRRVSDSFMG